MIYDLAVVGGGIMGLAHAYHAAKTGLSVAVIERGETASGASVRNFGMLAIVAQAPGLLLDSARETLSTWQEISKEVDLNLRQAGCLFLARNEVELAVLTECASMQANDGHRFVFLTPNELPEYAPNLRLDHVLGALWSPDAWKLDQRNALGKISRWLADRYGVEFSFGTNVGDIGDGILQTNNGPIEAKKIMHCGGDDFTSLFADRFDQASVTRCQLQMLRTEIQPMGWSLKPFILGGLSIPHYSVFSECPSLPALQAYQARHFCDYLDYGIHLIVCQEADGSITFGDSHLYGDDADGQRQKKIDELMIKERDALISLPKPEIAEEWIGCCAKHFDHPKLQFSPQQDVHSVTMTNGQGMTHGFAVAAANIKKLF